MTEYCQNCGARWGSFGRYELWFCQKCDDKLQFMNDEQRESALDKVRTNVKRTIIENR